MGSLPMLVMFVALLGMWFFMSRTQKKQQQERQNLLDSMKAGDEVVTIGGLHGVVSEIDETNRTVVLDCEGIFLEYDRAAIETVKPGTGAMTSTPIAPVEEPTEPEVIETVEVPETPEEKKEEKEL